MKIIHLTPRKQGLDVLLHWQGPGWYGPIQRGDVVEEHHISGFNQEGFAIDDEDYERCPRIWDYPSGLGTPHWLDIPQDYCKHYRTVYTQNVP